MRSTQTPNGRVNRTRQTTLMMLSGLIASWTSTIAVRRLRVERAVLAEAQIIAPRIDDVERALAPWARDYRAGRFAVDLIWREHAELIRARVDCVDVVDGKVQRLRSGRRRHASARDIEDGDDHAPAVEVVTCPRVALAVEAEQGGVELGSALEICDFERNAEQLGGIAHRCCPFVTERGPGDRQVRSGVGGSRSASHPPTMCRRRSRSSR